MCVKEMYEKTTLWFEKAEDIPLLFLRVILAYTFYTPAISKFSAIENTASFFDYLGIPFPLLNAYMAAGTELLGAVLLSLGLLTRLISVPLLIIMIVAITTVHGANGFHVISESSQWSNPYINGEAVKGTVVVLQNGYEMVMYYMVMLMVLVTKGAGRLSLDHLFFKKA